MTSVSYPGVYVEEIPGGARPIETASTSTAAFVGIAEKGPDSENRARRITSWQEYLNTYGGFVSGGDLTASVYQFFNNGGRQCYIVRVVGTDPAKQTAASITVHNRAVVPTAGVTFTANSTGAWGNALYLNIEDGSEDPGNTFTVSIYTQLDPMAIPTLESATAATPVEVHENLSMDPQSRDYFKARLAEESKYIVGMLHLNNIVQEQGFHLGGKTPQTTTEADMELQINIDQDGFQVIRLAANATLEAIRADIQSKGRALKATKRKNSTADAAFDQFACSIEDITVTDPATGNPVVNQHLKLSSGTTGAGSSVEVRAGTTNNAAEILKLGTAEGAVSHGGLSKRRPATPKDNALFQVGDHTPSDAEHVTAVTLGQDEDTANLVLQTYKDAFRHLDKIADVSLLAVPGVPGMFDAGVEYCENRPLRDIFFIGETDETDDELAEAESFRFRVTKPNSYGGIYFPWIKSPDPSGQQAEPVLLPPSGFIAGLFARIDTTRGVWKAPAGTEASISGAAGLAVELTDIQQGNLNKIGVNCLRRFPLSGIVSWGARTASSDPEYKYVPVRRTAIMLRRSIYDGIQWAVFEPNDHRLWASLRLNIGAFMNGLFRAGAFQGEKASDAYFVRCGLGDTMEQGDIDRGQVIVLIGFAALKPAEFVIVRIQQKAGQTQ